MRVSIGSDHGGYLLKEKIIEHFKDKVEMFDRGCDSKDSVDYPIYAKKVAEDIENGFDRGILICTNGIGVSIAANKFKGVRAALVLNEDMASHARLHNDANVICLGEVNQTFDEAIKFVEIFLDTDFTNEERHLRRVNIIKSFEV